MASGSGTGWLGGGLGSTVINPTSPPGFLFLCGYEPRVVIASLALSKGAPIYYGGPAQLV